MKLPELSEVQFQASAQSQAFDPLKLPDPNPQLQQNLSIIQQSFANLAQSGKANAQADYGMQDRSFLEQFAELVPKAVSTAIELQKTDVAIQQARADDRYFQMRRDGLIGENGELLALEQIQKKKEGVVDAANAEVAKTGNYDAVRGFLNITNHGEIRLRRRLAGHMFTNVYPDWMKTQLETNDSTVMVENEENQLVEVAINQKNLPDYQFKQVMSHLRTAFMGHEYLADTNNDLIQREMEPAFKTDAAIVRAYSRNTRANDGTTRFNAGYTNMFDEFKNGNLKALGDFQVKAASMYDKKGVNLINTPTEFFTRLISDIGTAAENGAEFPIGEFIMTAEFEDGQTFMQRAPRQAALLMRTYSDKRRTYLANKLKADTQDLKFAITEYYQKNVTEAEEPPPVSDFVAFKTTVRQRAAQLGIDAGDMLKVIDQQIRIGSYGADELNQLREQAEIALATGTASTTADYYNHRVVGPEYRKKVDEQVTRKETPEYKINLKQITDTIGGATKGTMVDPRGDLKGNAIQVGAHYQRIYDAKYAELMAKNGQLDPKDQLTASAIAEQARDVALSQWQTDSVDSKHQYYVNPKNGNFDNFPVPAVDQAEVTQNNNVRTITSGAKTQKGVLTQIAAQPQLSMTREAVSDAVANFSATGQIDPVLTSLQTKINQAVGKRVIQNPMQIAIAAAQGYGDLQPGEVPQAPAFLQRAATTSQKRQMMADLVGLKGRGLYTQPAKYGPTPEMPVRSAFQAVVQPTTPNRPSTQVVKNPISTLVTEGEGQYDSMFPGENYPEMLDMEIRTELVEFQKQKLADGRASGAVGTHQLLYPERAADLAGLPADAKFTPENQEKMFMATLLNKPGREAIADFLQGRSADIETAIDQMSMEFASIEYRNGESYYKDGVNKAKITRERVREALIATRDLMRGNQ
jgi:hypothetical protein